MEMLSAVPRPAGNAGDKWLLIAAGLLSIFIVVSTCYGVLSMYHPVPFTDEWMKPHMDLYSGYLHGRLDYGLLWESHFEHRILFQKILALWDYRFFGKSGYLLISLIFFFQGLHALLVCRALWRNERLRDWDRYFLSSIALIFFFWVYQRGNFTAAFQISFILNGFSSSLAAYLACRIGEVDRVVS